ncbi:MAG: flagellar basal body rod protein FlgB [bacterium]|jgi:flagellar basal-body rod protein FlgB
MFSGIYGILGESLNVLSDRQNIIASNVANANTPGYKAKELNFEQVMKSIIPAADSLPMEATSPKDLGGVNYGGSGGGHAYIKSFVHDQKDESIPPLDGNTVDLSKEMSDMTSNAIRFQAVAGLLSKKFATLNYAITNTTP